MLSCYVVDVVIVLVAKKAGEYSSVVAESVVVKPPKAKPACNVPAPPTLRLAVVIEVVFDQADPSYCSVSATLTVVSPPNAKPAV